jgi:hypothetical protein
MHLSVVRIVLGPKWDAGEMDKFSVKSAPRRPTQVKKGALLHARPVRYLLARLEESQRHSVAIRKVSRSLRCVLRLGYDRIDMLYPRILTLGAGVWFQVSCSMPEQYKLYPCRHPLLLPCQVCHLPAHSWYFLQRVNSAVPLNIPT